VKKVLSTKTEKGGKTKKEGQEYLISALKINAHTSCGAISESISRADGIQIFRF